MAGAWPGAPKTYVLGTEAPLSSIRTPSASADAPRRGLPLPLAPAVRHRARGTAAHTQGTPPNPRNDRRVRGSRTPHSADNAVASVSRLPSGYAGRSHMKRGFPLSSAQQGTCQRKGLATVVGVSAVVPRMRRHTGLIDAFRPPGRDGISRPPGMGCGLSAMVRAESVGGRTAGRQALREGVHTSG